MKVLSTAAALLLALFSTVNANSAMAADDVRSRTEMSMLVSGTIEVDADGKVVASNLEKEKKIPEPLRDYLRARIPLWKFAPVLQDGKPVHANNRMDILLVARFQPDGQMAVSVRSVRFEPTESLPKAQTVGNKRLVPPEYPKAAARTGASGTAYLVIKVGRDGNTEEAIAEQVNLYTLGKEDEMAVWRQAFADTAVQVSQRWRFIPPTEGELADDPYWLVRVPVTFLQMGQEPPRAGGWSVYVPGPRTPVPWADPAVPSDTRAAQAAPDAIDPHAAIRPANPIGALVLLTPLEGA